MIAIKAMISEQSLESRVKNEIVNSVSVLHYIYLIDILS